jgi:hypothetical protein
MKFLNFDWSRNLNIWPVDFYQFLLVAEVERIAC